MLVWLSAIKAGPNGHGARRSVNVGNRLSEIIVAESGQRGQRINERNNLLGNERPGQMIRGGDWLRMGQGIVRSDRSRDRCGASC